jgi:uncharacterized protein
LRIVFKVPPGCKKRGETYNLTTVPPFTMKLQPDRFDIPSITGYGAGWIGLDGEKVTHSVVIGSRGERLDWACGSFADLSAAHFDQLAGFGPELIVFGSGNRLRFPSPSWLTTLAARRIGVETMDTQAACRTYNILASEGRHVMAALLLEIP